MTIGNAVVVLTVPITIEIIHFSYLIPVIVDILEYHYICHYSKVMEVIRPTGRSRYLIQKRSHLWYITNFNCNFNCF